MTRHRQGRTASFRREGDGPLNRPIPSAKGAMGFHDDSRAAGALGRSIGRLSSVKPSSLGRVRKHERHASATRLSPPAEPGQASAGVAGFPRHRHEKLGPSSRARSMKGEVK